MQPVYTHDDFVIQTKKVMEIISANKGRGDDMDVTTILREARLGLEMAEALGIESVFEGIVSDFESLQRKIDYYHRTGFYADSL